MSNLDKSRTSNQKAYYIGSSIIRGLDRPGLQTSSVSDGYMPAVDRLIDSQPYVDSFNQTNLFTQSEATPFFNPQSAFPYCGKPQAAPYQSTPSIGASVSTIPQYTPQSQSCHPTSPTRFSQSAPQQFSPPPTPHDNGAEALLQNIYIPQPADFETNDCENAYASPATYASLDNDNDNFSLNGSDSIFAGASLSSESNNNPLFPQTTLDLQYNNSSHSAEVNIFPDGENNTRFPETTMPLRNSTIAMDSNLSPSVTSDSWSPRNLYADEIINNTTFPTTHILPSSFPPSSQPQQPQPRQARGRGRPPLSTRQYHRDTNTFRRVRSSKERKPHCEVERNYRQGMNDDLERLKEAIPSLPRDNDHRVTKGMTLRAARAYIKDLERECEEAQALICKLQGALATAGVEISSSGELKQEDEEEEL